MFNEIQTTFYRHWHVWHKMTISHFYIPPPPLHLPTPFLEQSMLCVCQISLISLQFFSPSLPPLVLPPSYAVCSLMYHWTAMQSLTKKNYTEIYVTYTRNILHIYVNYIYPLCRYMLAICICYIYVELGPTYMWHICKYMGSIWDW